MLRLFLFLIKILYLKGGEDIMAVIYATLIIKGRKKAAGTRRQARCGE